MGDPRVFFAAERTLLAWVRSGLTIIGLGFVVARFALFLGVLSASRTGAAVAQPHWTSTATGIALTAFGAVVILAALWNFRAYVKLLPPEDVPALKLPWLTSFLCVTLALLGLLLSGYLAVA